MGTNVSRQVAREAKSKVDDTLKLSFIEPLTELKQYVRACWRLVSENGLSALGNNTVAPNGCPRLVMPLGNEILSVRGAHTEKACEHKLYFSGAQDCPAFLRTSLKKTEILAIEFEPYGAYELFGIPMRETVNCLITVDQILSRWGTETLQLLWDRSDGRQKMTVLQKQLAGLLRNHKSQNLIVQQCVSALKRSDGLMPIQRLADEAGYSRRYLNVLFRDQIGLPPKVLSGIFRFQRFYGKWAAGRTYAEVKEELYDYYWDQSHFVKEFERMTGSTPMHYFKQTTNVLGSLAKRSFWQYGQGR